MYKVKRCSALAIWIRLWTVAALRRVPWFVKGKSGSIAAALFELSTGWTLVRDLTCSTVKITAAGVELFVPIVFIEGQVFG